MPRFSRSVLSLLTAASLAAAGCRVAAPVAPPRAAAVPLAFPLATVTPTTDSVATAAATDSAAFARQPWRELFSDPNLVSLIDTALQANPDLRITLQRIEIARADLRVRRGALLPQVEGVASAGVERFGDYTLDGVGNYDTNLSPNVEGNKRIPTPTPDFFLGLRSSWEIDLWGKLRQRRQAAYLRLLATERGRHLVQTQLVAEVARQYFTLLSHDNELLVLRKNQQFQERALDIVRTLKRAGRANELAVQQFRAQLLRTRALEAKTQQQIAATENTLNRLLGRYPRPIARPVSILEQPLPSRLTAGLPAATLLRRPDVRQAELELVATRADVSAARAAFLPSLKLTPFVGLNAYRASVLFTTPGSLAYGLLAGLSAPLFNRTEIQADYRRSVAQQQIAYSTYQKAIQVGFEEVTTNLRGIENYQRVFDLQQEEVEALQQAVSISDDLFKANYATYLEVISAQRNVLDAELELTDTRRQQFLLLIDLYRALGGGWTPVAAGE